MNLLHFIRPTIFCFGLLLICNCELSGQEWSIEQFKDRQHPILKTEGQHFDFRDDVYHHLVAEVNADLRDRCLHLNILAQSPRIGGYRSYRHIHGSNRLTARVLRQIADGAYPLQLRDQSGNLISHQLKLTESHLPERRLNPDGTMNYLAKTQDKFVVQMDLSSAPLSNGDYQVELFLDRQLRLQINFRIDETFQAVAFHSTLHFVDTSRNHNKAKALQETLEMPADWQKRDFEGKYFLFSQAIKKDESELIRWVDFLFEQKEYRLLEEIALTQPGGFDCENIGDRLAEVNAPNWPRLARWSIKYRMEHTNPSASGVIAENKDVYYSWCKNNQVSIPDKVVYQQQDVKQFWPRLNTEEVLAPLSPPKQVERFTGKKAESGKFYLQQFERAVATTIYWAGIYNERDEQLLDLAKHPNIEIRKRVLLAYTHLNQQSIPYTTLLSMGNDKSAPDEIRELAVLAASYGPRMKLVEDLNAISLQPEHPAWKAAVSRLGDIGSVYDIEVLGQQEIEGEEQQEILKQSIARIAARQKELQEIWQVKNPNASDTNAMYFDTSRKMSRVVQARLDQRKTAEQLQQWTNAYFQALEQPEVIVGHLNKLRESSSARGEAYISQLETSIQSVLEDLYP